MSGGVKGIQYADYWRVTCPACGAAMRCGSTSAGCTDRSADPQKTGAAAVAAPVVSEDGRSVELTIDIIE